MLGLAATPAVSMSMPCMGIGEYAGHGSIPIPVILGILLPNGGGVMILASLGSKHGTKHPEQSERAIEASSARNGRPYNYAAAYTQLRGFFRKRANISALICSGSCCPPLSPHRVRARSTVKPARHGPAGSRFRCNGYRPFGVGPCHTRTRERPHSRRQGSNPPTCAERTCYGDSSFGAATVQGFLLVRPAVALPTTGVGEYACTCERFR